MRVRTYLRRIRLNAGLSIIDVCACTGLTRGDVSMFERGHSLPYDNQVEVMRGVYGSPLGWYPPTVLAVLMPDLRDCVGCGDELDPDASRSRRYHSEACRNDARRLVAARRRGAQNSAAPV